jgi:hypothetical protein
MAPTIPMLEETLARGAAGWADRAPPTTMHLCGAIAMAQCKPYSPHKLTLARRPEVTNSGKRQFRGRKITFSVTAC